MGTFQAKFEQQVLWLAERYDWPAIVRQVTVYGLALIGLALVTANWHPIPDNPNAPDIVWDRIRVVVGIGVWFLAALIDRNTLAPKALKLDLLPRGLTLHGAITMLLGAWLLIRLAYVSAYVELPDYQLQLAYFFSGIALLTIGGIREPLAILRGLYQNIRQHPLEWGLVLSLTGLAFAVRVYRLEGLFPFLYGDEPPFLVATRRVYDGVPQHMADYINSGGQYLSSFLNAGWLYDVSLFWARMPGVVYSTLAIPGVYLLARRLVDWRAGLFAAMFLIGQPVHVHFSRYALNNTYDATLGIFAFLLVWDALQHGGLWKWTLAGCLLGMVFYFYVGGLLWYVLFAVWLLVLLLRQPRSFVKHVGGIALFAISTALVMLPRIAHFDAYNVPVLDYVSTMSAGQGDLLGTLQLPPDVFLYEKLTYGVRAYFDMQDIGTHFQQTGTVAINLEMAFLIFAMGLAFALRRALHPGVMFVLMWLAGVTLFAGGLTVDTPSYARLTMVTVALPLIAGMGLAWFVNMWAVGLPQAKARWLVLPGVILMLFVNVQDIHFITHVHPNHFKREMSPERWISNVLAQQTAALEDDNTRYYWLAAEDRFFNLRYEQIYYFYSGNSVRDFLLDPPTEDWLADLPTDEFDIYVFVGHVDMPFDSRTRPDNDNPIWPVIRAYPDAELTRYPLPESFQVSRWNFSLYSRIYIPKGSEYCSLECRGDSS